MRVTNLENYDITIAGMVIKPNKSIYINKKVLIDELSARKSLINLVNYNRLRIEDEVEPIKNKRVKK